MPISRWESKKNHPQKQYNQKQKMLLSLTKKIKDAKKKSPNKPIKLDKCPQKIFKTFHIFLQ
ncbi:MAG: hypothetical protein COW05_07130 [Gammaproteobacteria bacterium CG12_big_fil_rev_8_21_14_0_65_46_12]|nr:MAG: hypothetical protein COW05_07130 [Gammaproteobacteria bacterium CG12_big_fil_rev_8_21_14_0_65_46_12]